MKILLINPPDDLEALLGKGATFIPTFEPLGLLYVAAFLQGEGYDVDVIDAYAEHLSPAALKAAITRNPPDVAGFTTFTSNGALVYELGKWLKTTFPDIVVVLGNIHAAVYAEQYLRNGCCDLVVHGKGERHFWMSSAPVNKEAGTSPAFLRCHASRTGTSHPIRSGGWSRTSPEFPSPARDVVKQEAVQHPGDQ